MPPRVCEPDKQKDLVGVMGGEQSQAWHQPCPGRETQQDLAEGAGRSSGTAALTFSSATKLLALTMSSVVTPKILLGLYTPCFLKISAVIGMVELT